MTDPAIGSEPPWPPIEEISADVRAGRVRPDGPAREALRRIRAAGSAAGAFTRTRPPGAVDPRGRLAGVPFAIKDNMDLAGEVTTAGTAAGGLAPAAADATVVAMLAAAGAVPVGRANMSELACAAVTENTLYGTARNPWDPRRSPGGSSGGSAVAVAAGLVPFALGTDTGGSVLIPAALTGVCGIRPTGGRVPIAGVTPLSTTLDTVGVLATRARDLRTALAEMVGPGVTPSPLGAFPPVTEPPVRDGPPLAGLRVGVLDGWFRDGCDAGVLAAVDAAVSELRRLGASLSAVRLPLAEEVTAAAKTLVWAEAAVSYRPFTDAGSPNESVRRRLLDGERVPIADYLEARRLRTRWRDEVAAVLSELDVLAAPVVPIPPPPIGVDQEEITRTLVRLTYPGCMAGTPAVSLPCGPAGALPTGMQLIGPWGGEGLLLRIADAYMTAKFSGVCPTPGSGTG
ncbi:amidase [Actinomadura rubrisoli]|uniref:amidase n=1 Tax=Actinomadura rubrisoli TaxID=2530368 RepID=UPI001404A69C|nr:amidase [Actinomadura rubrisoli]